MNTNHFKRSSTNLRYKTISLQVIVVLNLLKNYTILQKNRSKFFLNLSLKFHPKTQCFRHCCKLWKIAKVDNLTDKKVKCLLAE